MHLLSEIKLLDFPYFLLLLLLIPGPKMEMLGRKLAELSPLLFGTQGEGKLGYSQLQDGKDTRITKPHPVRTTISLIFMILALWSFVHLVGSSGAKALVVFYICYGFVFVLTYWSVKNFIIRQALKLSSKFWNDGIGLVFTYRFLLLICFVIFLLISLGLYQFAAADFIESILFIGWILLCLVATHSLMMTVILLIPSIEKQRATSRAGEYILVFTFLPFFMSGLIIAPKFIMVSTPTTIPPLDWLVAQFPWLQIPSL